MKKQALPYPKVIVVIFTICFILVLISQKAYSAFLLDRVVATVNGEVITWSELRRAVEIDGREFLEGVSGEEKEKKAKDLEKSFLDDLIDIKLQLQEARKMGLSVSADETDKAISEIKKKYNLTDKEMVNSLKSEGLTLEEYRAKLGEQILLSKIVNFKIKPNIFISDEAIEEYYEANKEKYSKKEKVKIRQIFFAIPDDDSIRADIEAKAQEIFQRIKKGEDFAELARKYSEGSGRRFGGDLGYIERGDVLEEVANVAFALKKGEVSRPFRSPAGLHIIKVEDRIEGKGLKEIKEEIKQILFEEALKLKHKEWVKKLREKAYIEINL